MISLVVPTHNERQNIERLVERTGSAMLALGEPFEVIIVDDDSADGTANEVRRMQTTHPWLKLLVRSNERDLSTAVIAGWRVAQGDILGCMDADLQHPPEKLGQLLESMRSTSADIVIGSRHVKGGGVANWSLPRRFVSWTATLMATTVLPGTLGKALDPMSGFFLIRRHVIEHVALNPIGYKILLEVLARGDYETVREVPYLFEEREKGGSKMNSKTGLYYLGQLISLSLETGEASRILKYALVGLTGAVINFSLVRSLHQSFGWPVEAVSVPAIATAIFNNFVWNDLLTFPEARKAAPGLGNWLRRLLSFAFFSATGALLNLGILLTLHLVAGLPQTFSIALAIGIAGLFNFIVNSNLTWRAWWNRKLLSRSQKKTMALSPQPMHGMAFIPCNYCGSPKYRILYSGSLESQGDIPSQTFRCTSEDHGNFTNIVQCTECGLLFENPRETEAVSNKKYEEVEDQIYDLETAGRIRTFSKLMDSSQQYATRPGRLLDIGCYTGVFLDVAKARGWETYGVEPSRWAARKAQGKGHDVANAPLQQAVLTPQSFDMVTIWDVIEHMQDPQGQLKRAFDLLKPGGAFCLSTMDAGCLFAKVMGRRWPWFMRMHYYYFTRGSMTRMLRAAGFEVVRFERHKRIVSLRYLLRKGMSLLGPLASLGRFLKVPFGSVFVTVDLGDIMNVYCLRPRNGTIDNSETKAESRLVSTRGMVRVVALTLLCSSMADAAPKCNLEWTHGPQKIRPYSRQPITPPGGLLCARNTDCSLQLVLTAQERGCRSARVEISNLRHESGASIPAASIRLYRQAFVNVFYRSSEQGDIGEWPDPLIPQVDPDYGEPRRAFPVDVTLMSPAYKSYRAKNGRAISKGRSTGEAEAHGHYLSHRYQRLVIQITRGGALGQARFQWWSLPGPLKRSAEQQTRSAPTPLVDGISVSFRGLGGSNDFVAGDEFWIFAGRTRRQPVWADIFIRPSAAPGLYRGVARATFDDAPATETPIEFEVSPVDISATSSFPTHFGIYLRGTYEFHFGFELQDARMRRLATSYMHAGLRNHITMELAEDFEPTYEFGAEGGVRRADYSRFDAAWGDFFEGKGTPGGARLTSFRMPYFRKLKGVQLVAAMRDFVAHVTRKGWGDRLFDYTFDEPGSAQHYAALRTRAEALRTAAPNVPRLVTTSLQRDLVGVVTRWCPLLESYIPPRRTIVGPRSLRSWWHERKAWRPSAQDYAERLRTGDSFWLYISCAGHGCTEAARFPAAKDRPTFVIDTAATINQSAIVAAATAPGVTGFLFWDTTYAHHHEGGPPRQDLSPWESTYYFGGNGEGSLLYPGLPEMVGGKTHIAIESLRLKFIRESLVDAELLQRARASGVEFAVTDAARKAFSSLIGSDATPGMWVRARRELLEHIRTTTTHHSADRMKAPPRTGNERTYTGRASTQNNFPTTSQLSTRKPAFCSSE